MAGTTETAHGRVLGLDYGTERIGVAMCDGLRVAASPFEVLNARSKDLIARIGEIVEEFEISEVVVGLPTSLSGEEGPSALGARQLADRVASAVGVAVQLVDVRERYEWGICRLPEARHIPLAQLHARLSELDPGLPIVTYCHTGVRSLRAAEVLSGAGFRSLSLAGGVEAWAREIDPAMARY